MDIARRYRFEQLFADTCADVRAYARRRASPDVADEVVSEVFVVAWRRLDEVPEHALPWLLGCARRVLANQRRGERRRSALIDRLRERALPPVPGDERVDLHAAFTALNPGDREVLMLVAWEGLSHADGARVLGCSERAFAMRLHRARGRLAARLSDGPHPVEVT